MKKNKKGNDFIFKIGNNTEDAPVMLTSEQAIRLFEATMDEEPMEVDKLFDKIYQHVKANLYRSIAKDENDMGNVWYAERWLKSLKERYTWKPSDGQMDALHYVTNFDYGGHKATLVSLYEQLKKLKE